MEAGSREGIELAIMEANDILERLKEKLRELNSQKNVSLQEILEIRFDSDAGDDLSFREYFKTLLLTVYSEGEGFSGKRPFGNSSWELELYRPLVLHGHVQGFVDEDGYLEDYDSIAADNLIKEMIVECFKR